MCCLCSEATAHLLEGGGCLPTLTHPHPTCGRHIWRCSLQFSSTPCPRLYFMAHSQRSTTVLHQKKTEVKNRAHPSTHLATLHMAALQSLFPLHIKSEGGSSSKSIERLIKHLYSATLQSLLFSPSACTGGLRLPCSDQSL